MKRAMQRDFGQNDVAIFKYKKLRGSIIKINECPLNGIEAKANE